MDDTRLARYATALGADATLISAALANDVHEARVKPEEMRVQ
ncbi:MAG: hypothetical protein ABI120_12040 [Gemmatimonadaceae bacterium]